jgi:hypothetical protein
MLPEQSFGSLRACSYCVKLLHGLRHLAFVFEPPALCYEFKFSNETTCWTTGMKPSLHAIAPVSQAPLRMGGLCEDQYRRLFFAFIAHQSATTSHRLLKARKGNHLPPLESSLPCLLYRPENIYYGMVSYFIRTCRKLLALSLNIPLSF